MSLYEPSNSRENILASLTNKHYFLSAKYYEILDQYMGYLYKSLFVKM